jgi:putative glutamine amidotransferase
MRHLFFLLLTLAGEWFICSDAQDTLLLFHPTAGNLEVIESLVAEGVLDLEGYHVLGVFHAKEKYNYDSARTWLEEIHGGRYSLLEIRGHLSPDLIFCTNDCTEDFKMLFDRSRGALFMGGPDIPPALYHEPVHLLTSVTDPFRHYLELSYLFHLLGGSQDPDWSPYLERDNDYLVNGICLGMQTMNIATGGTLIQDIPTEVYGIWTVEEILAMPPDQIHRNYAGLINSGCDEPTSYHFHKIRLEKGSSLRKGSHLRGNSAPLVLSSHHQAVETTGKGMLVTATSTDGKIIEAIEHEKYPHVSGVQFHPEKPGLFDPAIIHAESCDSSINFQEVILETGSYEFHKAYWKRLGKTLQEIREQ